MLFFKIIYIIHVSYILVPDHAWRFAEPDLVPNSLWKISAETLQVAGKLMSWLNNMPKVKQI